MDLDTISDLNERWGLEVQISEFGQIPKQEGVTTENLCPILFLIQFEMQKCIYTQGHSHRMQL